MSNRPHQTTAEMVNQFTQEPNYSDPASDDYEALARDQVPVRSLEAKDLNGIVRVDKHVTGRDRSAYYQAKVDEVLKSTGIRVSLVAEEDGEVVGFIMARVDYGQFGVTDTTAVIDTLGVDPAHSGKRVGHALISQLLANLSSLMVDNVRTEVSWNDFDLVRFLERCGFTPAQRLVFALPI